MTFASPGAGRSPAAAALLALAVLLAGTPADAAELWWRASTPHFVLYAKAEADSVLRLARNLESMAVVLEAEGFGVRARARQRVTMVAVPAKRDFLPLLPVRDGKRAQVAGLAHKLPFGTWIAFAGYDERGRMVAHHELLHAIADAALGRAPLCLSEGLAEFFSTWRAGEGGGHYGDAIPWHQYVVERERPFTLDELFAVDRDSPVYARDGDAKAMFYAESWTLVHYLTRLDGRTAHFRELAQAIAAGVAPRRAFADAFPGENWDEIPGKLSGYASAERLTGWNIRLTVPPGELPVAIRAARESEVATQLGLWGVLDEAGDAQAIRTLLESGRGDTAEPGLALAGMGLLEQRERRPQEALLRFREVAARDDASALALSVAGGALLMQAAGQDPAEPKLVGEAYGLLERSVERDSTDAVALGWYGRAALAGDRLTPRAMRALATASAALPFDGPIASAWAAALSHTGQAQRAREVLASHGGLVQDREIRAATGAMLDYDAFRDSATALAKAGEYAALDRLLDRTEATHDDEPTLGAVRSLRTQLAAARQRQRWVDRYNDGVRALRASRLLDARAAFTAARDSAGDERLRGEASARLADLAGMIEYEAALEAYRRNDPAAALAAFERAKALATTDELRERAEQNAALMRKALAESGASRGAPRRR